MDSNFLPSIEFGQFDRRICKSRKKTYRLQHDNVLEHHLTGPILKIVYLARCVDQLQLSMQLTQRLIFTS